MHTPTAIALTLALATATSAHAVFKCSGPSGAVLYQDAPCIDGKPVNLSGAGPINSPRDTSVSIGMAKKDVIEKWGVPTSVNTTVNTSGRSEQWVYRLGKFANYVYLTNGVVTSMSSTE